MGRKVVQPTPHAVGGRRLKAARLALERDVLDHYAREAEIPSTHYCEHETGVRRITLDSALALKRKFGLSLDYIYDGDFDQLPHQLAIKIKPPIVFSRDEADRLLDRLDRTLAELH